MDPLLQISVDSPLILRSFVALLWGVLYALFLQHVRLGQFWVERRTWLTVVIGVGVDLLIAVNGDWFTVSVVIAFSAVPIIIRSLNNEEKREKTGPRSYKVIWGLEDAIALSNNQIEMLDAIITREGAKDTRDLNVARALSLAYQINAKVKAARKGDYDGSMVK